MDRTQVRGLMLLATLPLLACDGQGTAPTDEILLGSQRVHGLELTLRIDPVATVSGGNLTATFTVTNRRDVPTTLTSGCSSLARSMVYRTGDEEPRWFIGAGGGCFDVLSEYPLDAGESFELVWNATAAELVFEGFIDFGVAQWDTIPAPKGEYLFRVTPDVIWIDQASAHLPELQVAFRVK